MSMTPNYNLYVTDDLNERYYEARQQIYGEDNSNMIKIDAALAGKADKNADIDGGTF